MEMQPHEKLNFYLNWAYTQNKNWVGGFRGYEAEPVPMQSEEFGFDLDWIDADEVDFYHDELERDCDEPYEPDDAYADGQALASAGWGTDEDYGSAEDCY